jgi:hypothetical protein
VQADLEHAYFKPGTYTIEGRIGKYAIDKFKIVIGEE